MSDPTPTPTLRARVADARLWAGWMRALRAEIADRKDAGDLDPDLAAPEPIHQTLLEVLAAIDALPREVEHADLALPARQRLAALVDQLQLVHRLVDRWVEVGLLAARPPPRGAAIRATADPLRPPARRPRVGLRLPAPLHHGEACERLREVRSPAISTGLATFRMATGR